MRCIGKAEPWPDTYGELPENAISDRARIFSSFMREIIAITEHRTKNFKDSERADIQLAIMNAQAKSDDTDVKDDWEDMVMYACIYRMFWRVKWLDLPKTLPWRDDDPRTSN